MPAPSAAVLSWMLLPVIVRLWPGLLRMLPPALVLDVDLLLPRKLFVMVKVPELVMPPSKAAVLEAIVLLLMVAVPSLKIPAPKPLAVVLLRLTLALLSVSVPWLWMP